MMPSTFAAERPLQRPRPLADLIRETDFVGRGPLQRRVWRDRLPGSRSGTIKARRGLVYLGAQWTALTLAVYARPERWPSWARRWKPLRRSKASFQLKAWRAWPEKKALPRWHWPSHWR